WPYCCCAVTAEALKIITAPNRQSTSVTPNSQRSVSERLAKSSTLIRRMLCGSRVQVSDELLEDPSALLVILELVEAGAGRGQNHDISGLRGVRGDFHRAVQRGGAFYGHAAGDLLFNFVRSRANQERKNGFFSERLLQEGVVAALVFPAQNNQDAPEKSVQGLQGGVHVGGLRIVVVAHAGDFRNEFQPVLHAREAANCLRNGGCIHTRQARRGHGGQHIFNVVRARQRNFRL